MSNPTYKTYTIVVDDASPFAAWLRLDLTTATGVMFWSDEQGVTNKAIGLGAEPAVWNISDECGDCGICAECEADAFLDAEDTCGNCRGSLTKDDLCGYGGHDLNELCKENLPDDERYRCCDCLSDLTGECCCSECTDGDPVPFMLVPSI